jgi:hypothetical protein
VVGSPLWLDDSRPKSGAFGAKGRVAVIKHLDQIQEAASCRLCA